MKYKLVALETFETVAPATEMIFTSLVTGEEVGARLPVPESRFKTEKGTIYTARNQKERDRLVKSGKWGVI